MHGLKIPQKPTEVTPPSLMGSLSCHSVPGCSGLCFSGWSILMYSWKLTLQEEGT
jgi:hypothetical protein